MPAKGQFKEINKKEFEKLCGFQCTIEEISDFFECDDVTLSSWCKRTYGKRFSEVFSMKRGKGKASLRRKQYEVAMEGNPTMLVWLGRNWLGQSDKVITIGKEDGRKILDLIAGLKDDTVHEEAKEDS